MKFLKRGVALALLAAFTLAGQPAQAYEKDKTYKITSPYSPYSLRQK